MPSVITRQWPGLAHVGEPVDQHSANKLRDIIITPRLAMSSLNKYAVKLVPKKELPLELPLELSFDT